MNAWTAVGGASAVCACCSVCFLAVARMKLASDAGSPGRNDGFAGGLFLLSTYQCIPVIILCFLCASALFVMGQTQR